MVAASVVMLDTTRTPAIDASAPSGHNLRAILLRLADDDAYHRTGDAIAASISAFESAEALACLVFGDPAQPVKLTPHGREVAELLRPLPWREDGCELYSPASKFDCGELSPSLVGRIAALLTRDDLDRAKRYR